MAYLKEATDSFIQCRKFKHRWQTDLTVYRMKVGYYRGVQCRILFCDRCSMVRIDYLDNSPSRGVFARHYLAPDDYYSNEGRIDGVELEREVRRRSTEAPALPSGLAALLDGKYGRKQKER